MYKGCFDPEAFIGTNDFHLLLFFCLDSTALAKVWMVGYSKSMDKGNLIPSSFSKRVITWTAIKECPPISKKLSDRLMFFIPKASSQILEISFSLGVFLPCCG